MVPCLPLKAGPIGVEWETLEGGVGVRVATDLKGTPLLGFYTINRMGQPNGQPLLFPRTRLMTDIIIGFENSLAVMVFIDAQVTARGIELIVCPPPYITLRGVARFCSAAWGSAAPERDFYARPSNNDSTSVHFYLSETA